MEHSGSNTFMKLALCGTVATYGYYAFLGLKSPLPGQDQDVAQGLDVERHEFVTPDGVTLRLKRYANPVTAEQDVYPMISEWMKMLAGN